MTAHDQSQPVNALKETNAISGVISCTLSAPDRRLMFSCPSVFGMCSAHVRNAWSIGYVVLVYPT